MRSLRRPTFAVLIAIASTAALGPGTLSSEFPDAAGRSPLHAAAPTLQDMEAFLRSSLPGLAAGAPAALLADVQLEDRDFLMVDFAPPHVAGSGSASVAGGVGGFSSSRGDEGVHAGYIGNAGGAAHAPGPVRQPARSGGLQTAAIGPVSGFGTDSAPAGPSTIAPEDITAVDRDIQQLPLLAAARKPDGFDSGVGGQAGKDTGATNAVPEPSTMLLLGLGLLGLLVLLGNRRAVSRT